MYNLYVVAQSKQLFPCKVRLVNVMQQLFCFGSQVDVRIQDEDLRTRKFFHPVSYSRVIRECEARMVEDYIPYLQVECRQMVKEENRPGKAFVLLALLTYK